LLSVRSLSQFAASAIYNNNGETYRKRQSNRTWRWDISHKRMLRSLHTSPNPNTVSPHTLDSPLTLRSQPMQILIPRRDDRGVWLISWQAAELWLELLLALCQNLAEGNPNHLGIHTIWAGADVLEVPSPFYCVLRSLPQAFVHTLACNAHDMPFLLRAA
jgi:hypothetical protein